MALLKTPICDFGWPAPDFTLADPSGVETSLNDVKGTPFLIMFICNHCPYVQRIAKPLAETARELDALGIKTVAIMSNDWHDYPQDAPEKMQVFARTHGFGFPYLVDQDQSVARAYGAVCTPDFFGFDGNGGLQYRGNFEDPQTGARNLFDAMRQIAQTGHGPSAQIASMGCSIKWIA